MAPAGQAMSLYTLLYTMTPDLSTTEKYYCQVAVMFATAAMFGWPHSQ